MIRRRILNIAKMNERDYTQNPFAYHDFKNEEKFNSNTVFFNASYEVMKEIIGNQYVLLTSSSDNLYEVEYIGSTVLADDVFEVAVIKRAVIEVD